MRIGSYQNYPVRDPAIGAVEANPEG